MKSSFTIHQRIHQSISQLDAFYNGSKCFKKHKWDARRARDAEYRLITDRLLNLVGGSIGRKRDEANKVVIGVGLGKFSSKSRLSSLHESFQSYFVQKVRALPVEIRSCAEPLCCIFSTDFALVR